MGGSEGIDSRFSLEAEAADLDEPAVTGRRLESERELKEALEDDAGGRFSSARVLRDDACAEMLETCGCGLLCCSLRIPFKAGRLLCLRLRLRPRLWKSLGVSRSLILPDMAGASRTEPWLRPRLERSFVGE